MTSNSQLSTTEPKKQRQTKQTTRTGTEAQKWRSHGRVISCEEEGGRMEEKGTGIRSIIDRDKRDGQLRTAWEMEKPKSLYKQIMNMN